MNLVPESKGLEFAACYSTILGRRLTHNDEASSFLSCASFLSFARTMITLCWDGNLRWEEIHFGRLGIIIFHVTTIGKEKVKKARIFFLRVDFSHHDFP